MTPSDIANVRDVAWSREHELEMDTGFQTSWGENQDVRIEFDASAVFEHDALGTQTSVLAEAEALLSGVVDEETQFDDGDESCNSGDKKGNKSEPHQQVNSSSMSISSSKLWV